MNGEAAYSGEAGDLGPAISGEAAYRADGACECAAGGALVREVEPVERHGGR